MANLGPMASRKLRLGDLGRMAYLGRMASRKLRLGDLGRMASTELGLRPR